MLRTRLEQALKEAVLARAERAVSTLRLILAALKDRDIAERGKGNPDGLDETQIQTMLLSMIKQRRESIKAYEQGNRPELARQEAEEITIIEAFLPKQMNDVAIEGAVAATIEDVGGCTLKDMGRVMAALKERYAGQMDFVKASALVKQHLG
ncbi:MAG TPA: GatB/YqeY domain-containing protein [Candidatus Defluviicoccus seviourii]|nr:GatB/YqeY domain-containing protein [Candidatus Defluviicoccus seviourii]